MTTTQGAIVMAVSKREIRSLSNKDLLKRFRNISQLSLIEFNSRRGLTKSTAKSEEIIIEELCARLAVVYNPDDWTD